MNRRFVTLHDNRTNKPILVNLNNVVCFEGEGDNELTVMHVCFVNGESTKIAETQEQIENLIRG